MARAEELAPGVVAKFPRDNTEDPDLDFLQIQHWDQRANGWKALYLHSETTTTIPASRVEEVIPVKATPGGFFDLTPLLGKYIRVDTKWGSFHGRVSKIEHCPLTISSRDGALKTHDITHKYPLALTVGGNRVELSTLKQLTMIQESK